MAKNLKAPLICRPCSYIGAGPMNEARGEALTVYGNHRCAAIQFSLDI